MDQKVIDELAKKYGLDLRMYKQPRLTDMGDGTLRYISSGELTPYGICLVKFANDIERICKLGPGAK